MNFTVESYEKHGYTPLSFINCQYADVPQRNVHQAGYGYTLQNDNETPCFLTIPACLKHARASEVVRDDLRLPYILLVDSIVNYANLFVDTELRVSSLFRLKPHHT